MEDYFSRRTIISLLQVLVWSITCADSLNPIIVLPPAFYWNSSNFISVSWQKSTSESHQGYFKIFKDGKNPFATNIHSFRSGETVLFEIPGINMGTANNYKLIFHELVSGYKSHLTLPGVPDISQAFIQTDKPLYKAGQLVKIRVLPLTALGQISKTPLEIQLENPDRFILMSRSKKADGAFIRTEFQLPNHLSYGLWRIRVRPKIQAAHRQVEFFKNFEVKEYDLPHFQVKMFVESEEELFQTGETGILVVAKYSFGKPAFGEAKIYCGRQRVTSSENLLFTSPIVTGELVWGTGFDQQHRNEVEDGLFRARVNVSKCHWRRWRKRKIELTAAVRDHGTGDRESDTVVVERKDTEFKLIPLKPGFGHNNQFPIPFLIESNSVGDRHGKRLLLEAVCIGNGTRIRKMMSFEVKMREFLQLNVSGSECSVVVLNVTDTNNSGSNSVSKVLAIPKLKDLYPMIKVDPSRLNPAYYQSGDTFEAFVDLNAFGSQNIAASFLLICNNVLVRSGRVTVTGRLKVNLTENMVPTCNLIVFRPATEGTEKFPMVDIFKFFVTSACRSNVIFRIISCKGSFINYVTQTEVSISTAPYSSTPGADRNLVLRGPGGGLAAIRAYDERISYLLLKEIQIEARKYEDRNEWEFMLTRLAKTKSQTVTFSGLFDQADITNSVERLCQDAGRLWWNKYSKCPALQMSESSISVLCHEQFLSHCGAMDGSPTIGKVCENGKSQQRCTVMPTFSGRQPQGDTMRSVQQTTVESSSLDTEVSVRNFFPETWLFSEFHLNSSGEVTVTTAVPHSVTNWTVSGHLWGPGWQRVCDAAPISITSFKKFFLRVDLPEEVYLGEFLLVKATVFLFDRSWRKTDSAKMDHKVAICYRDESEGICTDLGAGGRRYGGSHVLTMVAREKNTGSKTLPFEFLKTGLYSMRFDLRDFSTENDCDTAPVLDSVQHTVVVKDRESIEEYYRSFIMNPSKPKTSVTTHELDDENLQYIEFLDEDNDANRNKLRAQVDVRVGEPKRVKRFVVELSRFLSNVRPTTALSVDKDTIVNNGEYTSTRRRSRRSTQFLSEILKKAAVVLYAYKAGSLSEKTTSSLEDIETSFSVLADIFTFSDCHANKSQCGYSQTRWPTKVSQRSQWLTILATSINCESGMNATVICPSLRWILMLHQAGRLKSDYTDAKLATAEDENILLKSMVFLMIYQCASYQDECVRDSADSFPLGAVAEDLYFGFNVDEKTTDPIAVASLTYAVSYANSPLMDVFQHHLYATVKQKSVAPYWTYGEEESMMQKLRNKLSSWFGSSKSRLRKANEILLNSLGFLAFIKEQTDGIELNLDPLADWLFSQQKTENGWFYYTLDTYFATRAIYLYKLKKKGLLGYHNLTVTVDCSECSFVERRLDDRTAVIHIPSYAKRLRVSVSGMDKVKFGVRMILSRPQRTRRHVAGDSGDSENWPMNIRASTVITGPGPVFNQTVCLKTTHSILTDMVGVEHGVFTGYSPDKRSFALRPGTGCAFHGLDVASHVVQFLLTNLTADAEHCYSLTLSPPSVSHASTLAPVPVMTKHPEHGLTGMVFLRLSAIQEVTRSQVDKICYPDDHCVCTEGSCQSKNCGLCQREGEIADMTEFVCQQGNFGAIVKSLGVEKIGEDYVRMTASIRHVLSPDDPYLTECEQCEIYQRICRSRGRLKCLLPEENRLYFIAGISKKWHVDANSTMPVYFIGENDYFEQFLSCPADWQQRVLSLSSDERRLSLCRDSSTRI